MKILTARSLCASHVLRKTEAKTYATCIHFDKISEEPRSKPVHILLLYVLHGCNENITRRDVAISSSPAIGRSKRQKYRTLKILRHVDDRFIAVPRTISPYARPGHPHGTCD